MLILKESQKCYLPCTGGARWQCLCNDNGRLFREFVKTVSEKTYFMKEQSNKWENIFEDSYMKALIIVRT